jgi:phage tail-like protein
VAAVDVGRNLQRNPATGDSPDPALGIGFLVKAGFDKIGLFQECSGLSVEYDVYTHEEGGESGFVHKLRGRAKHPNLVLKRGVTHQKNLSDWFFECKDQTKRREISIDLLGRDQKPIRTWAFDGAFPVKWTGPTFNAGQGSAAIEQLEIVHKGFRDMSVG